MNTVSVDLRVRRCGDLPTLRALEPELRALGVECRLSVDAACEPGSLGLRLEDVARGPVASDVRVIVEPGPGERLPVPEDPSRILVVVWDSCQPPQQLAEAEVPERALASAQLVLVPGSGHVKPLSLRTPGRIEVAGLARLDSLLAHTDRTGWDTQRAALRQRLGIFPQSALVVLVAVGEGGPAFELISERAGELAAEGVTVALLPRDLGSSAAETQRRLAARAAGLVVADEVPPQQVVASADLVAGAGSPWLWEAHGLGLPTVLVEPGVAPAATPQLPVVARTGPELQHKIRVHLQGAAAPLTENDWLDRRGSAARRIAFAIREVATSERADADLAPSAAVEGDRAVPEAAAGGASDAASSPSLDERLASIEARAAFGDDVDALSELRDLVATSPSVGALRLLASLERKRKQFEVAADISAQAVTRARTELSQALCERGRVEIERAGASDARPTFEEASRLAPDLADPLVGLGTIALHTGDPAAAEAHFRRALELEKSGRTYAGLGLALTDQGRHRDALSAFDASLDLDPECQAALYGVVQAGFHTGELRLAADRLGAYIELHPGNLDFTFTLAGLLCQLGEVSRAGELADRIAIFAPDYPDLEALREKLSGPK